MDLTLDFLRMSIPLPRLVKGVPGYEIPEEIGFFACEALEMSVHPERIDERLELFHWAERGETATYKRVYCALQYAYYWLRRMVLADIAHAPARQAFMRIRLSSPDEVLYAVEYTNALLQEYQNYIGEDLHEHSATELGLVEALSDFLAALRQAQALFVHIRHKKYGAHGEYLVGLGTHFSQLAWRATACVCEYFAPNGSFVNLETHEPYHRQWQRIAVEMLDMFVALELPNFTGPGYFQRAVAPSQEYFQATRGAKSRSPIAPSRNQTPEHSE